jgi:hypothetical protein
MKLLYKNAIGEVLYESDNNLIIYRSFDSNETVSNDLFKEVMIQYI